MPFILILITRLSPIIFRHYDDRRRHAGHNAFSRLLRGDYIATQHAPGRLDSFRDTRRCCPARRATTDVTATPRDESPRRRR